MSNVPDSARPVAGAMTALVTPFREGHIDWSRLENLVEHQIAHGIDWLVPCGTTGEAPTLTDDEQQRMIEFVVARARGRVGVMAGTGSNCTATAVAKTRRAEQLGADAALVVAPYYNRPSPDGLFRHFEAVAGATDLPIVLYNVPFRTGVNLDNEVVARLYDACPTIVAIKHATGSVDGVTELVRDCDITVLSGDDVLTFPLMCLGAVGVISVVANLWPRLVHSLVSDALAGNMAGAASHHRELHGIAETLGRFGPNPVPIKTAMAAAGLIEEEFRLPLSPVDPAGRSQIADFVGEVGMLETAAV